MISVYNYERHYRIDINYEECWFGSNFIENNHAHMVHDDIISYLKDRDHIFFLKKEFPKINDLQDNNGFMHMITADDILIKDNRSKYKLEKLNL